MKFIKYILAAKARYRIIVFCIMFLTTALLSAQVEKKYVRKGNREYGKDKYSESEILYRKALDKAKIYPEAVFNTGDALYRQDKFEDAGKQFRESSEKSEGIEKKSAALYNLGNSLLNANKVEESVEAYENSRRINPGNMDAKFNLAHAQDLLRKNQQQQQNQNNEDNKNNEKKDQKQQDQKQQDQNKQNNDQKQDQKQQQPQQSISKEDAERLLNAIANDEKDVQEKVRLAKAAKERVKTSKNW